MLKLTQFNFRQEVINSKCPVLVEFYSDHCSKCAMMEEVVESLEETFLDKVKFGIVNTDESKELEKKYGIEIVPTFMMFKDGIALGCMIGVVNEETIAYRIEEMI